MSEKKNTSERTALDDNHLESVAGGRGRYTVSETDDGNFHVSVFQSKDFDFDYCRRDDKLLLTETFNNRGDAANFGRLASRAITIKEERY